MPSLRGYDNISRLMALLGLGGILAALPAIAGTVGSTAVTPTSVTTGKATTITVTSVISDPTVIAGSVILQRLNISGNVVAIVGTLNDSGLNGDAVASDGTYTIQTTVLQDSPGTITFRVSAGFKGSLVRAISSPVTVSVTGSSAAMKILPPVNFLHGNTNPVNVTGAVGNPSATAEMDGRNYGILKDVQLERLCYRQTKASAFLIEVK